MQGRGEISMLRIVTILLRYRRTVLIPPVTISIIVLMLGLAKTRTFTAETVFVAHATQEGRAAQLAGQFSSLLGIANAPSESPEFYAELIRSPEILRKLLSDSVVARGRDDQERFRRVTVLSVLQIEGATDDVRAARGVEWLRNRISASTSPATGTVHVSVTTPWPDVSQFIAERIVAMVGEFNRGTRQSRAALERGFVGERLREAQDSLMAAQSQLRLFLESNRQFVQSPELAFEHDRLQREVAAYWQLLSSHRQAYESARIAEVRNTPVVTVLEHARLPIEPDSRGLLVRLIVAGLLGFSVGAAAAMVRELIERSRIAGADEYTEFSEAWSDAARQVRRVMRR